MDIIEVEEALKVSNPSFTSFYSEVPYIMRFDKCIEMYNEIMALD